MLRCPRQLAWGPKVAAHLPPIRFAPLVDVKPLLLLVHDAAGKEVGRSEARGQADAARTNVTVALPPIALAQAALWSPARPTALLAHPCSTFR